MSGYLLYCSISARDVRTSPGGSADSKFSFSSGFSFCFSFLHFYDSVMQSFTLHAVKNKTLSLFEADTWVQLNCVSVPYGNSFINSRI